MTPSLNQLIRVIKKPQGIPAADTFTIEQASIPTLHEGQLLVQNEWLSVEPAMRGWLADARNYASVEVGQVMRALCVGRVLQSRHTDYQEGELLLGWFGWQHYAVCDPEAIVQRIKPSSLSPSLYLGVLGLNGVTAATAFEQLGQAKAGDTVVVSTAAGSVGSCVGQLAKAMGCRTVGLTSSAAKVQACYDTFGYDAVINYKTDDLPTALSQACPEGVNVYFDNTAGAISDAVMPQLAIGARVVICGTASIPQWNPAPMGPRVERILLTRRARMQGFIIFDHMDTYSAYVHKLEQAVLSGQLRYTEHITEGLESALNAISELYQGENLGKRLIRL